MDDLTDRVKTIAIERLTLNVAPEDLQPSENLAANYGVDSVRLFDLVVSLEEDFGISFEDQELKLDRFSTIADIVERIRAKQS